MSDRTDDARIAEGIFGWKWVGQRIHSPTCLRDEENCAGERSIPHYSTDPAASKRLREKLAERWDWNLGHAEAFAFAVWPKGTPPKWTTKPTHVAVADTEERAIVLCALKTLPTPEEGNRED